MSPDSGHTIPDNTTTGKKKSFEMKRQETRWESEGEWESAEYQVFGQVYFNGLPRYRRCKKCKAWVKCIEASRYSTGEYHGCVPDAGSNATRAA